MPIRSFNQGENDMSLKDISAYLYNAQGTRAVIMAYDRHGLYAVSGNSKVDMFLCVETGKLCIPCENSLQKYQRTGRKTK